MKKQYHSAMSQMQTSKAFSLVELSIVLVILGLLVGGVLSGQSLIHAAELRSVTKEYQQYVSATNSFKDKYFALPADMTNAVSFWGSAGGTGSETDPACAAVVGTGTQTCNGDGNGKFDFDLPRFWQHLANAGLIEGQYKGVMDASWPVGSNPVSKIQGNYWTVATNGGTASSNFNFAVPAGNMYNYYNSQTFGGLAPQDAWNIDTKMDDGLPATGSIRTWKGTTGMPCTNLAQSATNTGGVYNMADTQADCYFNFMGSL